MVVYDVCSPRRSPTERVRDVLHGGGHHRGREGVQVGHLSII